MKKISLKRFFTTIFCFSAILLSAQSEDSIPVSASKLILKTDLFSPLRGNHAASILLDYRPKNKIIHSVGVDIVFGFAEVGGDFSSIPYNPRFRGPSGAVSYGIKYRTGPNWQIGATSHLGAYTLGYKQLHCMESEPIDAGLCKCTQWNINSFDHTNLRLTISGVLAHQTELGRFIIGKEVKIGVYRLWSLKESPLEENHISCPNISSFPLSSRLPAFSFFRNDTYRLNGGVFRPSLQLSLFIGYKL